MDTSTPQSPITDPSAPEGSSNAIDGTLDLSTFIAAINVVGKQNIEFAEFLEQVGQLLTTHAKCGLVSEVKFTQAVSADGNAAEPSIKLIASRFSTCPENVRQWAFTSASRAFASQTVVTENSTSTDSNPVAMISIPIPPSNSTSDQSSSDQSSSTFLSAMFIGEVADNCLPFMQIVAQQFASWQTNNILRSATQISRDVASLQEICLSVADSKTIQAGCRRAANNLKTHLDFTSEDQTATVYVGTVSGKKLPELVCVSGSDSLPDDTRLVQAIESAMAECISRNTKSQWPTSDNDYALMCHKSVSQLLGDTSIASYELPDSDGNIKGVLLVQTSTPLTSHADNFLATAQPQLGIAISLVERGEQNKLQKLYLRIKNSIAEKKTQTILKIVSAVLLLGFIPLPYQIKATSEVQPAEKMFLYAPFPAPLKASLVEPGDLVQKGAELARLDDKELTLELAEVQAKLHRSQKNHDGFVATHEPGEARLARHESEMLTARLEILEQRSAQLVLRSPIDGIVIAGDWKNAAGMPLETGQSLFEVAPLEKLSVDIFLPEDDVRYAQVGQSVSIKFDSYPFESFQGQLHRIHPAAEIKDAENVFVATVLMDNPEGKLRPGMKGDAKCQSVWRPIWWNLMHKPAAKCMRYFGW